MSIAARNAILAGGGTPPFEPYWGLYFEAEQAGCIVNMNNYATTNTVSLECSLDAGATWTDFDGNSATGTTPVTLAAVGDRVYFRTKGTATGNPLSSGSMQYRYFTLSKKAGAHGNIMSLAKGNEPTYTIPAVNFFYALFDSCVNLTTAPDLPATALKSDCYNSMFYGCTSLTTGPDLMAHNVAQMAYAYMFYGCSSLNSIKTDATDWVTVIDLHKEWVQGVASRGTFTCPAALGNNSTIRRGTSYCPNNWNVVNT